MNVKLAAGRINLELLELIATNLSDPAETETVRLAAAIIRQLLQPWMAFGAETCTLCGESPADNNTLRAELLDRHIHPPADPAVPALDVAEYQAALGHANQTIATRNHEIADLTHQIDDLTDRLRRYAA